MTREYRTARVPPDYVDLYDALQQRLLVAAHSQELAGIPRVTKSAVIVRALQLLDAELDRLGVPRLERLPDPPHAPPPTGTPHPSVEVELEVTGGRARRGYTPEEAEAEVARLAEQKAREPEAPAAKRGRRR